MQRQYRRPKLALGKNEYIPNKTFEHTCWLMSNDYASPSRWAYAFFDTITHICVRKLTNIGSDNGLSPGRHQAITWTNAGIWLIWNLGTHFSEILSGICTFSFKTIHLKMSTAKWRQFCLGLDVLTFFCGCCILDISFWDQFPILLINRGML